MPVLSYVHELFNVDQCHAYIHTLRWKEFRCNVPGARATTSIPGAYIITALMSTDWCKWVAKRHLQ